MFLHLVLLLIGVFACSTAVIFIKASSEHAVLLSSYRLFVAAIALTPVFLRDLRRHRERYKAADARASVLPGVALGLHFISWIIAARLTTATNASLIVNLVPVAMPFLLFFMIGEKVNRSETAGTALALGGTILLGIYDFNISLRYFWGDVLCIVSMVLFAWYLALGRQNRHIPTTWLYVVPLYYVAAVFCFLVAMFFVSPIKPYTLREIMLILALGFVPTIAGHSLLNRSLKHLRGQVVSLLNMAQFIFAGIMAYFFLGEAPDSSFYIASALVVAGSALAIRGAG